MLMNVSLKCVTHVICRLHVSYCIYYLLYICLFQTEGTNSWTIHTKHNNEAFM